MFSSNRPNATDPDHTGRRAGGDRSAGGTGSSPQAVMLYSVGHGNYSTVAEPPPEMAGALMFGHRTGNVRSVEQTPSAITVVWTHPDLPDREVTYTFEEGEYHADL